MTEHNPADLQKLTGEESNYHVLELTLAWLKDTNDAVRHALMIKVLIMCLEEFLKAKRVISAELDVLARKARGGDDEAAKELIKKLTELKDGP